MNQKILLAVLFFVMVLSPAMAFTIQTTAAPQQLLMDALYDDPVKRDDTQLDRGDVFAATGGYLYTLDPRYKADGKAEIAESTPIEIDGAIFGRGGEKYTFVLNEVLPKAYVRGSDATKVTGSCSARCSGPEVSFTVSGGTVTGGALAIKKGASRVGIDNTNFKLQYTITNLVVPEYKETWLKFAGTDRQTWYLLLGPAGVKSGMEDSTPKDIIVEFCISVWKDGKWSDCAATEEALAAAWSAAPQGRAVSDLVPRTPKAAPKSTLTLQTTAVQTTIDGQAYYALRNPSDKQSSILPAQEVSVSFNALDVLGSLEEFNGKYRELGNYKITLKEIEPTVFILNGFCDQRCCGTQTGPKVKLQVDDSSGFNNIVRDMKAVYYDYSGCQDLRGDEFKVLGGNSVVEQVKVRVASIEAPVFVGTTFGSKTNYVMSQGSSPDITVKICVMIRKSDNSWSECVATPEELLGETSEPLPGSPAAIAQNVNDNTDSQAASTDNLVDSTTQVQPSQNSVQLASEEVARCNTEISRDETLLVAKTKWTCAHSIGCPPPDNGKWNEFVDDEPMDKVVPVQVGSFSFTLKQYWPRAENSEGKDEKAPRFFIAGKDGDTEMDCSAGIPGRMAGYVDLDTAKNCDYQGASPFLKFKVYNPENGSGLWPYFKETSGGKWILTKGSHCYDVWAYLALKFRFKEAGKWTDSFTWWMKTKEQVQSFLNNGSSSNLKVIVRDGQNQPIAGATVDYFATVEGEQYASQSITNNKGEAFLFVPIDVPVAIKANARGYNEGSFIETFSGAGKLPDKTINLGIGNFDMYFVYSRGDFWNLFRYVVPFYYGEQTQPITIDDSYLKANVPTEADADRLYAKVPEFLQIQTMPCKSGGGEVIKMVDEQIFKGEQITGYGDYPIDLFHIITLKGMVFGNNYYACYKIPTEGGGCKTREVPWYIDGTGKLTEDVGNITETGGC
ncbi:MAG: Ig-like domain-containing protein [Candidatus Diapherotrites archaeon]